MVTGHLFVGAHAMIATASSRRLSRAFGFLIGKGDGVSIPAQRHGSPEYGVGETPIRSDRQRVASRRCCRVLRRSNGISSELSAWAATVAIECRSGGF